MFFQRPFELKCVMNQFYGYRFISRNRDALSNSTVPNHRAVKFNRFITICGRLNFKNVKNVLRVSVVVIMHCAIRNKQTIDILREHSREVIEKQF